MADGSRRLTIYSDTESRVNELIRRYHDNPEGPMFDKDTLAEVPFDTRVGMAFDALEGEIERLQQEQHATGNDVSGQVGQLLSADDPTQLG